MEETISLEPDPERSIALYPIGICIRGGGLY